MATAKQVKDFIAMIAPIAVKQAEKHGNKIFASVCIAQACAESGYGTAPKMVRANAVFGIKVGDSKYHFGTAWKDKAYSTKTRECYDGKTYKNITDMFRAYDTIEEAVEDYFDLVCTAKRYRHAWNTASPKECIEGIQKAPYATDPNYIPVILDIIKTNNLTQYDSFAGAPVMETQIINGNPYTEPTKNVKLNSKGNDVRWVQFSLNRLGYKLVVDGKFGEKTLAAVIDFQEKAFPNKPKEWDGIVGALTRAALKKVEEI